MTATIRGHYAALVASGAIESDPAQVALLERLDALLLGIKGYRNGGSALGRLFGRKVEPPRGLYVWGAVGRGKTMLMDLLFEHAEVPHKQRIHFHAFMTDVHRRIHLERSVIRERGGSGDPIPPVAAQIAAEATLLAFDEFQVTDIADAMILGRLFERLFAAGVVVVATSNVPPDDLYRDGLNRTLFLPFIEILKDRLDLVELVSRTDFRLEKLAGMPVWYTPANDRADAAMDAAFLRLAGSARGHAEMLTVQGRQLAVPNARSGVARFDFSDLCSRPVGAADFLAIAERYHTVLIDRIPRLSPERRNETRRFIILIDALYDHRVKLVASAEAEPQDLVQEGRHAFEFERTASRLIEMRSRAWLELPHGREDRPHDADSGGLVET